VKDETMTTTFRWIGSLSSALQAGLDHAVSAELHSITSEICRSRAGGKRNPKDPVCTFAEGDAHDERVSEKIAA
jgi:hypothetical protein